MAEIKVRTFKESATVMQARFVLPVVQSTTLNSSEFVPFVLPVEMEYPALEPVPREDNGTVTQYGGQLWVVDKSPSRQDYVTPEDDNALPEEERTKVSDVTLDLLVSHDSYVKFAAKSEDGFRAVLDANGRIVASSHGGYEVEAPRFGTNVTRTVITNSDFQLTINLSPTIIKAS